MKLCKHSGAKHHDIWHPLYSENRVLVAANKIGTHNIIKFSKAKSMPGLYYVSGKTARKYKKTTNGVIDVLAVPLSELEPFELASHCSHEL